MKKWDYLCLLGLLLLESSLAADQVVINSQDWTDVYSGMIYSRLSGVEGNFVIDEAHGLLLQETLDKGKKEVTVVESITEASIRNYHLNLQARGFDTEVILAGDNLNLELAENLEPEGYIVMNKRYSYNSVSVAPYAVRKNYYVLFADAENIDDVYSLLTRKEPGTVIIYGFVDREVTGALEEFNPKVINKGDKFSNNLEILKLFNEEFGANQLMLTNGAFIEPQFFQGLSPVLFIGQSNIPEQTMVYIKASDISHAVLIGYDLFNNAVTLKNEADLKVIVKFAKGIDARQYALDMFQLPQASFSVLITTVSYNTRTRKLEISYYNPEESPAFMKVSHTVLENNQSVLVVGDQDLVFIGNGEALTSVYDAELNEYSETELNLRSNILFGEDRGALEYVEIVENPIDFITYEDRSDIAISKVFYDRPAKRFVVVLENTGDVPVYATPRVRDIMINNKLETLVGVVKRIEVGKSVQFRVKAPLTPEDIEDNPKVTIGTRYGTREKALIHYKEQVFDLKVRVMPAAALAIGVTVLIALLGFVFFILWRKKGKKRIHKHQSHHAGHAHRHPPPPPRR